MNYCGLLISCVCHIVFIVTGNESHLNLYCKSSNSNIVCFVQFIYFSYLIMVILIQVTEAFS